MNTEHRHVMLDGRRYDLEIKRGSMQPPEAPRLIAVSYLPTAQTLEIIRVLVQTVARFTPEPHELWIVDNNSPEHLAKGLLEFEGINVVLSRTEPLPPGHRGLMRFLRRKASQRNFGSYANAVGLELALQMIDPQSKRIMSLHQDTMPCREGWLSYLNSKINDGAGAAGVRWDTARTPEGILHVLGMLVDGDLMRQYNLSFWPDLPQHDVGDLVSVNLRAKGHRLFHCRNTQWDLSLVDGFPSDSPFRNLHVDRSLNDEGEVIFLHLGRGVTKTADGTEKGTTPEDWIAFADEHLLA